MSSAVKQYHVKSHLWFVKLELLRYERTKCHDHNVVLLQTNATTFSMVSHGNV